MPNLQNSDDAKNHAIRATTRYRSLEESLDTLANIGKNLSDARDDDSRKMWQEEAEAIENWLNSEKFKSGDYPQGIDELILELVEWRAMQYSLQNVPTTNASFTESVFFQQWLLIGSAYSIFSLLGKLAGKDSRENSLRNLWIAVSPFISSDGACEPEELDFIDRELHRSSGRFAKGKSRAMEYRNTVIAHNQKSFRLDWNEIDQDIKTLMRVWSVVVSWCSLGVFQPFRTPEQAFSGLGKV